MNQAVTFTLFFSNIKLSSIFPSTSRTFNVFLSLIYFYAIFIITCGRVVWFTLFQTTDLFRNFAVAYLSLKIVFINLTSVLIGWLVGLQAYQLVRLFAPVCS